MTVARYLRIAELPRETSTEGLMSEVVAKARQTKVGDEAAKLLDSIHVESIH